MHQVRTVCERLEWNLLYRLRLEWKQVIFHCAEKDWLLRRSYFEPVMLFFLLFFHRLNEIIKQKTCVDPCLWRSNWLLIFRAHFLNYLLLVVQQDICFFIFLFYFSLFIFLKTILCLKLVHKQFSLFRWGLDSHFNVMFHLKALNLAFRELALSLGSLQPHQFRWLCATSSAIVLVPPGPPPKLPFECALYN